VRGALQRHLPLVLKRQLAFQHPVRELLFALHLADFVPK
jgi:hypothetical protein